VSETPELEHQLALLRAVTDPTLILRSPRVPFDPVSVGLLSSSFDPMTIGHAALARAAGARVGLVVFTYSVRTMTKDAGTPEPLLPELDRIAGLEAFCRDKHGFAVGLCSHGLLVEQVTAARALFPGARLSVVMGSDKLLQLFEPRWYQDPEAALDALFSEADVLYAVRAGQEVPVNELLGQHRARRWRERVRPLDVPADVAAISSGLIRELHRRGEDVRRLVPPEVATVMAERA
jgi:nicotinamide-nucleotide adenylyltransferase